MNQAIISCFKGEQWPVTSFKSWVEASHDPIIEDSIIFLCPVGHKFTLKQALKEGIFTDEQAQKLLADARALKAENYGDDGRIIYKASDFTPNQKVIALGLSCVRCGKKAQMVEWWWEPEEKWPEFALCLDCRADWGNVAIKEYIKIMHFRTWGRPLDLLEQSMFKRFVQGISFLDSADLAQMLQSYRWQTRKKKRKL